jgi:phosphoglycolate phosphatase-like HAD superfamily hydrolase
MLVLFDIDGTLLLSRGAGVHSMEVAGRRLFHPGFSMAGVSFAGMLDTLIWRRAAEVNGIEDHERHEPAFRQAYIEAFEAAFRDRSAVSRTLPGVADLLASLAGTEAVIGLVTGNYPETGTLKIREAGLDPDQFVTAAWGCDGGHRRELPPLAIERHAAATGRRFDPSEVVVIGDTPHDIDCARHSGCRSLAVGTGPSFTREDLERERPDHYVADLSQTEAITDWILGRG